MLLIPFLQTLALAGVTALIAVVYRYYLLADVLHWWLKIGERFEKRWFFAPIWGCHKCIAGQLALWSYLITHLNLSITSPFGAPGQRLYFLIYVPAVGPYSFICHIFAICAAILGAEILTVKIINKL